MQPYIFFDAGGTLIFPDWTLLREVALRRGYDLPSPRWARVASEFGRLYDDMIQSGQADWDVGNFVSWMLERLGVARQDIAPLTTEVLARARDRSLWHYVYPWLHDTLGCLTSQGYRMSVISNSDGRVKQKFVELGLRGYFEEIFDSHLVGYEKPDRRLFQHAIESLDLQPRDCLHIGDLYYVDVLGANRAGIAAIHVDPYHLYDELPGVHLPNAAAVTDLLDLGPDLADERFHPFRDCPDN